MDLAQVNFNAYDAAIGMTSPNDLGYIIGKIIPYAFAAAGFLLVIYLVIGGLEFIFSLGDPKKTAMARGKITNALLGFLVVFVSYLIVQIVANIFNLTDLQSIFK
jgi:hypothetical protein